MDYYCQVCDIFIEPKSKYKHFKSNIHKELKKCKHIKVNIENNNINGVDRAFYTYIIEHNKKFDFFIVKCLFKLVFMIISIVYLLSLNFLTIKQ